MNQPRTSRRHDVASMAIVCVMLMSGCSTAGPDAAPSAEVVDPDASPSSAETALRDEGTGSESIPVTGKPADLAADSRLETAVVTLEVDGDVALSWEREQPVRIVTFLSERFLSVGVQEVLRTPDGKAFRFAFDLLGAYDGAGTYVIPPSDVPSSERDPRHEDLSNAFLHFVHLDDPDGPIDSANSGTGYIFDRTVEPCTVDVAADEMQGTIVCPALASADGARIEMTWSWVLVT